MRRAAVVLLFAAAVLSPAAAFAAPKWSVVSSSTANRGGYTASAPDAFVSKLKSGVGAFVGPSFDLTGTVGAWANSALTASNGYVTHSYSLGPRGTIYTATPGEDFAVVVAYGHFKDWRESGPEGGALQFFIPRINGSNVLAYSPIAGRRDAVFGNESDPYGGYGYAIFGVNDLAAVEPSSTMPGSKWQSFRSFYTVAGKWNAGANAWRVRTRVWTDDGSTCRFGWSRETTYSAVGLASYVTANPDGYSVEKTTRTDGKRQITRIKDAGTSLTNVEFFEGATTTNTAEVARIYDKEVGQSAVDVEPSGYWETPPSDDEEDGSGLPLTIGGWKSWITEKVTGPVNEALSGLSDLLWFVEPAKEWFGLGD